MVEIHGIPVPTRQERLDACVPSRVVRFTVQVRGSVPPDILKRSDLWAGRDGISLCEEPFILIPWSNVAYAELE